MIFFSLQAVLGKDQAMHYSWSVKMNKVISDLLRLVICHKTIWKESLLHFNYQHLEKRIATLEENSLQRVSPTKNQPFSHFNNKFHKETTENQLGHEKHLLLLWVFKRHQLLEVISSTICYIMQLYRPSACLRKTWKFYQGEEYQLSCP